MPIPIGSSPLKMATVASTLTPQQAFTSALTTYVHKYCEVMTGNRVTLQGLYAYANGGWLRFKCQTCHDNWNMKSDLFDSATSCPSELTDWLEKHQHVCQKFNARYTDPYSANPICDHCRWPWEKHAASKPNFDIESGTWVVPMAPALDLPPVILPRGERKCVICQTPLLKTHLEAWCRECFETAKKMRAAPKNETRGRLFRKEQPRCELLTDTNETTSPVSEN